MKIEAIIVILFSLLLFFSIIFFISNLHTNQKFRVYLEFLGAVVILFTIFALIIQIKNSKETTIAYSIYFFSNLTKGLIDEPFQLFIENNEVDYYYRQLVGIDYKMPKVRNKTLENQITMIILSKATSVFYFIKTNEKPEVIDKFSLKALEDRFLKTLGTFFRSPIFRENWIIYKKNLSGGPFREYIEKNFPQYVS